MEETIEDTKNAGYALGAISRRAKIEGIIGKPTREALEDLITRTGSARAAIRILRNAVVKERGKRGEPFACRALVVASEDLGEVERACGKAEWCFGEAIKLNADPHDYASSVNDLLDKAGNWLGTAAYRSHSASEALVLKSRKD